MQLTTLITVASTLALTTAFPTFRRANTVSLTFKGAADAAYTISIPTDSAFHNTNNVLSISSIFTNDINFPQYCSVQTVDYTPALVAISGNEWNVGPPQTVTAVKCSPPGGAPEVPVKVVHIEFQGADPTLGAKYGVDVKLDGSVVVTNNKLSISTIYTTYQGLPGCTIKYADYPAALSKIATDTWAVGPPQWVESISCKA